MMRKENIVGQGMVNVHHKMINYMLNQNMESEAAEICAAHAVLPKFRQPSIFTVLDKCDRTLPVELRPTRARELTVEYALQEL